MYIVLIIALLLLFFILVFRKNKPEKHYKEIDNSGKKELEAHKKTKVKLKESIKEKSKIYKLIKSYQINCQIPDNPNEYEFQKTLINFCIKNGMLVLTNLYVPFKNNTRTTEIDAVVVTETGVFCLEYKNYSGEISGNHYDKNWVCVNHSNESIELLNPIIQNVNHISILREYLDDYSISIHNIVVFANGAFFNKNNDYAAAYVTTLPYLESQIKDIDETYSKATNTKLSSERIKNIYKALIKCCNVSDKVKEKHLNYIKQKYWSEQ